LDQENESPLPSPRKAGRGWSARADRVRGRSGRGFTGPSSTVLTAGPPSPHGAGRRLLSHPQPSRPIPLAHFVPIFYLRAPGSATPLAIVDQHKMPPGRWKQLCATRSCHSLSLIMTLPFPDKPFCANLSTGQERTIPEAISGTPVQAVGTI
jgi:hypothetical protein